MEEYLNKGIKEIMNQFPEVENILNEYGIGCAPCSVSTCLLKDIVEIHSLPAEDEILYPWMDSNLSTRQIGELFTKFNEMDEQIGFSPTKYETFIDNLEKKLNP